MPVKLGRDSPAQTEARIEIIPLIDIMFFLLAAFMLVSLSMVNLKRVKVDLPAAATAGQEAKNDLINLSVDKAGVVYLDKKPIGAHELAIFLNTQKKTGGKTRVLISGDKDARHGDILRVLDIAGAAGIRNIAFETTAGDSAERN